MRGLLLTPVRPIAAALFFAVALFVVVSCGSTPAATVSQPAPAADNEPASSEAPSADSAAADQAPTTQDSDSGGAAETASPVDDAAASTDLAEAVADATAVPVATVPASDAQVTVQAARTGVERAPWAGNVALTINGDGTWRLQSDGVPSHEIDALIAVPRNGNNISARHARIVVNPTKAQSYDLTFPLAPTWSDAVSPTPFGPIGIMVSGAALFNPYEAGGGIALDTNFEIDGAAFIDACNGHPQRSGAYHYHGVPYCITDAVDTPGQHSRMIGILLDGYPVYGPQDADGQPPIDLDVCKGHVGPTPEFPDGIYHYHLLETGTYSIDCYHGVAQQMPGDLGAADTPRPRPDSPGEREDGEREADDAAPARPDRDDAPRDSQSEDPEPRLPGQDREPGEGRTGNDRQQNNRPDGTDAPERDGDRSADRPQG